MVNGVHSKPHFKKLTWPNKIPQYGLGYTDQPITGIDNTNIGFVTLSGFAGIAFLTQQRMSAILEPGYGANLLLGSDLLLPTDANSMRNYMMTRPARLHLEAQKYGTRTNQGNFIKIGRAHV